MFKIPFYDRLLKYYTATHKTRHHISELPHYNFTQTEIDKLKAKPIEEIRCNR